MEQRPPPFSQPPLRPPPGELPPMRYGPPKTSLGAKLKKIFGPFLVVGVLFVKFFAKIKFLILPLLKFFPVLLKTGGSMILMIGVYAMMYGWKWAVGFVLLLLIHECGHLIAAKRLGLPVSAPMFIPFMGAIITLKEAPKNAWVEAQVGIGGPLLGSAGAVVCYGIYMVTGQPLFAALAYTGFFLNLFNLAPIGFLDGGRIVTALSPWLWLVGTLVMLGMLFVHFNFIVLLILFMSLPRLLSLFRKRTEEERRYFEVTPGQRASMALLYFGLAAALALGMKLIIDSGAGGSPAGF
jgi:Zn-dependent protease